MEQHDHFDVIVIGIGSMGSATCWHLADRGYKVLGLEQFNIAHENGSHTGQSRIIRKAYFEHPHYVPLLQRAYENWRSFEKKINIQLYEQTGIIYMGRPDNENIKGILRSSERYNIPVEDVSREAAKKRFPYFSISNDFKVLFEPEAGFVTPERAIRLYADEAIRNGAMLKINEKVIEWKEVGTKLQVTTNKEIYTCEKLILTAGSWSSQLIPTLKTALKVTKQLLAWVKPKNREVFSLGKFPCWFVEDPEQGTYYGFPVLPQKEFGDPEGLKVARHFPGEVVDPDRVDRSIPANFENEIRHILQKYIPDADGPVVATKSCFYTYSDDEHFIIDHLPGYSNRVTIACGFSGHGFKFIPVVGEALADLATEGKTDLPIGFLRLDRFR